MGPCTQGWPRVSRDFARAGKGPSWEGRQALLGQRQSAPGPCGTEETRPLGTGPGGRPRAVSPHRGTRAPTWGLGLSRSLLSLWPGLLTPPEGRLFPGDSPSSFLSPCLFPGRCLVLVSAWLHLATPQRSCVWGGRDERGGGNSTAKKTKQKQGATYPAGERDKDSQRLPFSRAQSRTCQAARAKYRGREEPGPGRGLLAPPATLTQLKQATPSTTSSMKKSAAARPSGSGNPDCVATETTTSRESPGLARRGTGTEPRGFVQAGAWGPGSPRSPRTLPRSQVGGKGPEGNGKGGRQREKEAGLDPLPPPSPSPEVGCPTLPKVLCWVTAGRG